MKLKIFKGFNKEFLSKLDYEPLYESPIEMKFNILIADINKIIGQAVQSLLK